MIVVTTPTGHIGSQVVQSLVAAKQPVRVIARNPDRFPAEIRAAVGVIQGSSDDEDVLMRALKGAESLLLVVPPSFAANDVGEEYLRFTRPVCHSIQRNGVKRVVTVSGLGRNVGVNAGPVTASFAKDAELERTGVDLRALWCPGFMENLLRQVDSLKQQGMFFFPRRPDRKAPLVATRDIAGAGVKLLLDKSWTGQGGLAVLGPEDLSFDDMAGIMTDVLQKPIRFCSISGDAFRAQMIQRGASEAFAQSMLEMCAAKDNGLDNAEPRTPENTTPTSFRQWCQQVLLPAFLQ